jgi:hypothetical protein
MKTLLKISLLTLVFSGNLIAQENESTNSSFSHYYNTELFQWSYSIFGGMTLNFQNQNSIAMYGIKDSMVKALLQYEDADQKYHLYHRKTIAGHILMWGGAVALLTGAYIPFANENNLKIGLGVVFSGFIFEIVGAFMLESGQENIFDAVNLYNRHKIDDYK